MKSMNKKYRNKKKDILYNPGNKANMEGNDQYKMVQQEYDIKEWDFLSIWEWEKSKTVCKWMLDLLKINSKFHCYKTYKEKFFSHYLNNDRVYDVWCTNNKNKLIQLFKFNLTIQKNVFISNFYVLLFNIWFLMLKNQIKSIKISKI